MDEVVLVDREDHPVGTMGKMEAHRKGLLHRAFSVLLFNTKGDLLIQKRSMSKYHSGGLWTNTCCSHPLPDEDMHDAMRRKLKQEMGIEATVEFAYKFIYKIQLENDLIEHEYDHVYVGRYDGTPKINSAEVSEWRYASLDSIRADAKENPHHYTPWFKLILGHAELVVPAG